MNKLVLEIWKDKKDEIINKIHEFIGSEKYNEVDLKDDYLNITCDNGFLYEILKYVADTFYPKKLIIDVKPNFPNQNDIINVRIYFYDRVITKDGVDIC